MMSQENVCRLCAEICQDYKSLYDESGNANEVQQLMIQYFDENLLHMVSGNTVTVMCMKCCHTILDFNSFQQSIYRTQKNFRMKDEEIDIKSEEEFLPEDHIARSNCEQPTDWNILVGVEATLPRFDKETVYVPLADNTSNTSDSVEYDDPVGVFLDLEFGDESNSSELLLETELIAECNEASKIKDRLTKSIPQKKRKRKRFSTSVKASDAVIAQWTPVLKCIFCTETCTTFSLLQRHFQDIHPLLKCEVKCCSRNFFMRCRYEDHIRLHIDSNAFACTFCGTKKTSRRNLANHIRKYHPVPIDATRNRKNDSNNVSASSAKVTRGRKYCETKFINDFIVQMKPTLNCYLCPEKFKTFSLFRQHFLERHPGEKFYIKCCKRKLTEHWLILEHLQLHANPDVFKCKLCEVRCKSRDGLKTHMRKRHATSTTENENIRKIKNEKSDDLVAKWFPCTECAVCEEEFATLTELEHHFLECHPREEFYVECCQRKLMTRCKIVTHVRYHVKPTGFKCDLCCICYSQKKNLQQHMRLIH